MSKKSVSRRRRSSAVVAVVAGLSLLVTGTLAWQSLSQRAVNNREWEADATGGRLHDDVAEDQDWIQGGNEDIYVENYSGKNPNDSTHVGRPIYVRVQIAEYMEIGQGAGLYKYTTPVDPINYQDLDRVGTDAVREEDTNNEAESVIPGASIIDLDTWQVHIPESSVENDGTAIDHYWKWTMGGSKVFMPTFNKDNESLLTDRTENAHDQYADGATETKTTDYEAGNTYDQQDETHTAKSTLDTAGVKTMAEWIADGKPATDPAGLGYWVGDTDGWFYWSKALMPGDATGLLVDGAQLVNEPTGKSYYAAHVTAQMASAGDWGDEGDETGFYEAGMTSEALDLLNRAAGIQPTVTSISIAEGKRIFVKEGESITLHADVNVQNGTGDPGESYANWSISPANSLFVGGTLTTEDGDAGTVYTVTAASAAMPNIKTASATVVVYPAEAERVVEGESDGKYYVDLGDNTYQNISDDGVIDPQLKSAGEDEKIGNTDDKSPVIVNDDDIKLLGPNGDGSYYVAGDDGKLGTTDDDKMWPVTDGNPNDLLDYDPDAIAYTVALTQVSGTGNGTANTVQQEGTIQYTAIVKKSDPDAQDTVNADDQTVKWELLGDHKAGTTIANTDGTNDEYTSGGVTLTVAADETIGVNLLTLRATSREGSEVQTVNVSIAEKPSSPASETNVGGYFTDDAGVEWLVLAEESGSKLIMTKYVYGYATYYNTTTTWTKLDTAGNNLKSALQTFYQDEVGADTKAVAVAYQSPLPDVRSTYGGSTWSTENTSAGWSHAGNDAATPNGSNAVFVLSISEVYKYLPNSDAGRVAYDITSPETARIWWLRSPGPSVTFQASNVHNEGYVNNGNTNVTSAGYRPALWVQS